MNAALLLELAVSACGERVAVTDGRRSLTTSDVAELAAAGAAQLVAQRAESLVYVSTHGPVFAVAFFAAATAGVPIVPLNYRLPPDALRALLANHPGGLVVADDPAVLGTTTAVRPEDWLASLSAETTPPPVPGDPELPAVLLYTSGTTSAPKAVVLRHRHLTSYVLSTVELAAAGEDEAALVSVPPYHVAGVANLLTNLYAGRRLVVLDAFAPESWLATAAAESVTQAMVVPTMLARLVDHLAGATAELPALRSLAYGGARTTPRVLEAALAAFPDVDFVHAYGLTETSSTIAVLGPDDHRRALDGEAHRHLLRSVGQVIPGVEVEIRDADGQALDTGQVGRVWLRGEQISGEYVGHGSLLTDDGWFDTRDRGSVDADGYLYIEGRDDDTIIRGAENIAPAEIEDVLLTHDGIAEAVVVGLPDEEWGQSIAAVIVPAGNGGLDGLDAWMRERLRGSRTPQRVEVWDELPCTDNGKVIRARVIERLLLGSAP